MKRYCFALDLKDDKKLIEEYVTYHKNVWPEILESISSSGILEAEIYLVHNRLFMLIETTETFTLKNKAKMDNENEVVQKWENLMWNYQQQLPGVKPGEKWMLMERIFKL
ncbi:L-rhamnose mutarotase [Cellulophaga baltica]|uniref:L-rhamnose mutarotase n=1 Tax=Cellulophaga TaxID=104264 RepID=UPI001C078C5E|nr:MULTISPECIES: L-rhamnose mutarotase [Cellulophaga]MBU2998014.1 L-rhamnose mutarotase [Cellulophaga baltica]MDO6769415.1 L-rhamnose mutarotase [Cellulophaga sp. 1_MG-2023]